MNASTPQSRPSVQLLWRAVWLVAITIAGMLAM
jgi:hypothetical protein